MRHIVAPASKLRRPVRPPDARARADPSGWTTARAVHLGPVAMTDSDAPQPRRTRARDRLDDGKLLLRLLGAAAFDPYRPLVTNLVITRRCNLSCGYCQEYDKVSPPVPFETMAARWAP